MNWYSRAIQLLCDNTVNSNKICIKIAQKHPKLFVLAAEKTGGNLDERLRRIYSSEGKIPAIKWYRQQAGVGLQGAKDHVERVCEG